MILKNLEIENYRNIKHTKLDDLRSLNIFVGPNNCGKTSILHAIAKLSNLDFGGSYGFSCPKCQNAHGRNPNQLFGARLSLDGREPYLGRSNQITLSFALNEEEINNLVPMVLEKQKKLISETNADLENALILKGSGSELLTEHVSIFAHNDVLAEIRRTILFLPEGRLQTYKGKNIRDYIRDKNLRASDLRKLLKLLGELVYPRVSDHTYALNLIEEIEGVDFEATFEEQGSGTRSLACIIADIISEKDAKIVLIDEPELGLNPFSKQELLKFLSKESESRQIFIATHDPTFVNPVLWKKENVAVFLYSLPNREFVKIDLTKSQEDPDTFAGYLPHTICLKKIHLYVEGTSDVYIFQIFVQKYLKQIRQLWLEMWNKIGVYHLGGDFWQHLLYTIPKSPYDCLVILDGDKRQTAKDITDKYNRADINVSKFEFYEDAGKIKMAQKTDDPHPIYCLKKKCLEEYLEPKPLYESPDYNKKIDGPKIAEAMVSVPEEIERILDAVIGTASVEEKLAYKR